MTSGFEGFIVGVALGASGLIPFLHANTVVELVTGLFNGETAVQWFAVMLVFTRLPFEFIASAKLFIAREDTVFSLHPFQKLAQRGESGKAVKIAVKHCGVGIVSALVLYPVVSAIAPEAYAALKPFTGIAIASLFAVFLLLNKNKTETFAIAALAGVLGVLTLEKSLASNALFLLLTGLFAVPVLLERVKAAAPAVEKNTRVKVSPILGIAGGASALAASFFPGISVTVMTALLLIALEKSKEEEFIALNASIIGGRAVSDFAALEFISKARSGAAASIMENSFSYGFNTAALQLLAGTAAFAIASIIAMYGFQKISFSWLETKSIRAAIIIGIAAYAMLSSGAGGLIVLLTASLVGITATRFNCGRAVLSSAIILPAVKNFL